MPKDIYMNAGLSLTGNRTSVDTGDLIVGGNVGIGTTTPAVKLDVNDSIRGATQIVNQSNGNILPENCYGDTIYITNSGGTLFLPSGVAGMNLYTINSSGENVTLKVQLGEYLDNTINGTDNLSTSGNNKPYIHKFICGATGRWYILH